jgi:hypothetical protein
MVELKSELLVSSRILNVLAEPSRVEQEVTVITVAAT